MKKVIFRGVLLLIGWWAFCNYDGTDNKGDEVRPDIRQARKLPKKEQKTWLDFDLETWLKEHKEVERR